MRRLLLLLVAATLTTGCDSSSQAEEQAAARDRLTGPVVRVHCENPAAGVGTTRVTVRC